MAHSLSRYLTISMLATASLNSFGAGYQIYQGVSNLGNAFAGEGALAEDANIVFNNPAATVFLQGLVVTVPAKAALVSIDARMTSSHIDPLALDVQGNNRENGGSWNIIPAGFVSYTFMNHRFAVGLGVSSPWGLVTDYTNAFQARYVATHSRLTTVNIGPTFAWQIFPCFSIGAGFDAQYADADIRQHIFTGTPVDGNLISELDDWGYGWNVGLFYHIAPTHTNLALTYRSRVKFRPDGDVSFVVPDVTSEHGDGHAHLTNPDFATFSFAQEFCYGLSLLGTVGWTHWSLVKEIPEHISGIPNIPGGTIHFNFGDTWRVGLAGNYHPNECWTLRLGVMYDESTTGTHSRTIVLPDSGTFIAAVGVNYKINRIFNVDAGYEHRFIDAASVDQTVPIGPGLTNTITADIRSNINVFGLQLNMQFL